MKLYDEKGNIHTAIKSRIPKLESWRSMWDCRYSFINDILVEMNFDMKKRMYYHFKYNGHWYRMFIDGKIKGQRFTT